MGNKQYEHFCQGWHCQVWLNEWMNVCTWYDMGFYQIPNEVLSWLNCLGYTLKCSVYPRRLLCDLKDWESTAANKAQGQMVIRSRMSCTKGQSWQGSHVFERRATRSFWPCIKLSSKASHGNQSDARVPPPRCHFHRAIPSLVAF